LSSDSDETDFPSAAKGNKRAVQSSDSDSGGSVSERSKVQEEDYWAGPNYQDNWTVQLSEERAANLLPVGDHDRRGQDELDPLDDYAELLRMEGALHVMRLDRKLWVIESFREGMAEVRSDALVRSFELTATIVV
jgi:hypothetical protein